MCGVSAGALILMRHLCVGFDGRCCPHESPKKTPLRPFVQQVFRRPLNTHKEHVVRVFDGLDHSLAVAPHDLKPPTQNADGLIDGAVHLQFQPVHHATQAAGADERNLLPGHQPGVEIHPVEGCGVIVDAATPRQIEPLAPAIDRKDGIWLPLS